MPPFTTPLLHDFQFDLDSFRAGQRSAECKPLGSPSGLGLGSLDMPSVASSSYVPNCSDDDNSGNLKVVGLAWLEEDRLRSIPPVA